MKSERHTPWSTPTFLSYFSRQDIDRCCTNLIRLLLRFSSFFHNPIQCHRLVSCHSYTNAIPSHCCATSFDIDFKLFLFSLLSHPRSHCCSTMGADSWGQTDGRKERHNLSSSVTLQREEIAKTRRERQVPPM